MITRKCGCKVTEEGYTYSECKYHKTHCHYNRCKKKLKKYNDYRPNEYYYCKEHQEQMSEEAKTMIGAYGGSDF